MNMPPGLHLRDRVTRTACWFKINITYNGTPQDTTTWSANVIGDPVHLIK